MNNIKASLFLSSYLETLGYYNGTWEFNWGHMDLNTLEEASVINMNILHEYFSKGGFQFINLTNFISSDDTILIIYTANALLDGGKEEHFINNYLKSLKILKNVEKRRDPGMTTTTSLDFIKKYKSIDKLKYSQSMGGNAASIRTGPIGLYFNKEEDIPKLIETSIIAGRVTHNNTTGFLGGLVTALFTNFALRKLKITTWIEEFLKYENDIDNYMKKTNIYKEYMEDKEYFFDKWRDYQENKVSNYLQKNEDFSLFNQRMESLVKFNHETTNFYKFGASGLSSTIFAYDSLLMAHFSNNKMETNVSLDSLVFYSTLHFGDNDSTGAIAGTWYGALYGFEQFDEKRLKELEFYKELLDIFNKFTKN